MKARITAAVGAFLSIGGTWLPAYAQDSTDNNDPGWVESAPTLVPPVPTLADPMGDMLRVYSLFCLKSFPDAPALDKTAAAYGATPFTSDEAPYLAGQPGRGWTIKEYGANYVVTVLQPPNAACSVERMTPSGFSSYGGLHQAVTDHLALKTYDSAQAAGMATSGTGGPPPGSLETTTPSQATGAGGVVVDTTGYGLADASGDVREYFMVYVTNYHGQPPDEQKDDAAGGDGVEIQISHLMSPAQ